MLYFYADDEKFDGYDTFEEAQAGMKRLKERGFTQFSGVFCEDEDEI